MKKRLIQAGSWVLLMLLMMQFVPLDRINPTSHAESGRPEPVEAAISKGCYDCHSNRTRWPRAAYIAPASWLLSTTVARGRKNLNFSEGNTTTQQNKAIARILRAKESHASLYFMLNPEANLSGTEQETSARWFEQQHQEQGR